jgi:hypothetical protein
MAAWILPAVSAAASVASSIFGGSSAAKKAKQASAIVAQNQADNQAWYNRRYNEDYSQTAEAQNALNSARTALDEQYKKAAATAAVTGATGTAVAQQKAAANAAMADTAAQIAKAGTSRKDSIESQYMANDASYDNQRISILTGQANNISSAAGSAANTFGQLASVLAQKK